MALSRLIQIVPRRALAPEGVGDYARLIAERLRAENGITTSFVSGTPLPPAERCRDEWQTIELARRHGNDLLAALAALEAEHGDVPVLLHLSAYGFQDKGVPFWLVAALRRWRQTHRATPLVTVFHELYATGPVWSSPFWLGWVQAGVARAVQGLSNAGIATTDKHVAALRGWHSEPQTWWMPCFSTIGEPKDRPATPASQRPARLVIFGRAGILGTVYRDGLAPLADFVRANGVTEIVDIGARPTPPPAEIAGISVDCRGEIDAASLGAILAEARFGLVHYDADRLAKSSIFGAYCAHRVIPLCISDAAGDRDGLAPGADYVKLVPGAPAPVLTDRAIDDLQARAEAWYEPHSIGRTVSLIRQLAEGQRVRTGE